MTVFDPKRLTCPLCGSSSICELYTIDFVDPFKVSRCSKCTFIFMNPAFSDNYISSLYGEDYYSGKADYSYIDERKNYRYNAFVWKARIKKIRSWVEKGNFLDIGCSFGGLLQQASDWFTPYGVEISKSAADYCISQGINTYNGTLENASFEPDFFSIITMIELIEHIKEPLPFLQKAYSLLKPGGLCVIQTADMNGWQARIASESYHYFLPGHLSYFSADNLIELLDICGFKKTAVYRPVDFGLIPKLLKSRGQFKSVVDYLKWFSIAKYHFMGYRLKKGIPLTSSMVIYAVK
ncbi:MAG: class I SAM-dependent methyltransferase [Spirochaetes bacterium]|nr:class I SAM-dependent methyltransferase [Spirochaetota bacterium]